MGRKGRSNAHAAAERAVGLESKSPEHKLPPPLLFAAIGVLVAVLTGYWFQRRAASAPVPTLDSSGDPAVETVDPAVEKLLESAKKHFGNGHLSAGIDDLVLAQKRDVFSMTPAELLESLRAQFAGADAPRHARSAIKVGMERLQLVLYEALYEQKELEEDEHLFQLAKFKMLYHNLSNPEEASSTLYGAEKLLSSLEAARHNKEATTMDNFQIAACSATSQRMTRVARERSKLTAEILAHGKTASEIAARILPSPPFRGVDRRANLSLKEYRDVYLAKGQPVVITDYADKLLGRPWGWEEMDETCGDMEVIVSERSSEARHLWASLGHSGRNESLGTWIKSVRDGTAPRNAYVMDWGLVGRCNAFLDKFVVPKYFASDLWKTLPFNASGAQDFFGRHPSVFVGAAGSGGALHVDSYASTFWQVLLKGRKRWTLYALPDELRRTLLYAGVEHEIMPIVPASGEKHDPSKLPLLDVADAFKVVFEVSAGDLVVVPHDIPHMVENLEDVLAIAMNVLDDVAVPRLLDDLHCRQCFSSDEAIQANIKVLEQFTKSSSSSGTEDSDVPFAALRPY